MSGLCDPGGPEGSGRTPNASEEGLGSEGQGLGFNICVVPCDVHGAQLTQRDEGLSHNGEEWRED